jgi:superfamily II DNA or RNA helicase
MDQWLTELIEGTVLTREDIALQGGGWSENYDRKVILMSIDSARTKSSLVESDNPRFLIVDECHRAGSIENRKGIDIAAQATLGLSATPERHGDDFFETELIPVLGNVIIRYDYVQAMADEVLSPFELVNVRVRPSQARIETFQSVLKESSDQQMDSGDIVKLVTGRMKQLTAVGLRLDHVTEKAIIFHERIANSNQIHGALSDKGHTASLYNSRVGKHLRAETLFEFRRGVTKTLVTCRALDEGLNVPDASVGIIVAWTKTTRQRIQRLGRVLRPAKNKTSAVIYTLYSTKEEEKILQAEAKQLNGVAKISWKEA